MAVEAKHLKVEKTWKTKRQR